MASRIDSGDQTYAALRAFTEAKKPGRTFRTGVGTLAAVTAPLNFVTGGIRGLFKGVGIGVTAGNKIAPVVGALVGGLVIGPVVGAAVQSRSDVAAGIAVARRFTGRYAFVNGGLSVRSDSIDDLTKILSSIPENRVSRDPTTGHTLVTIEAADRPFLAGRRDAAERREVDVDALLETTEERGRGARRHMVAIKARDLQSPESQPPELCRAETDKSRTSIYIQSNIQDPHIAGLAGLQFFDTLALSVAEQSER